MTTDTKRFCTSSILGTLLLSLSLTVPLTGQQGNPAPAASDKPAAKEQTPAPAIKIDAGIPTYETANGVSGNIKSIGSDSMINLMQKWTDNFRKLYPGVGVEIEGKGSGTAPPALVAGTANFGPMSRPMKADEVDSFEKQFGYKPSSVATSIDMLGVYVHKDNPLKQLTLQQIDAIFSKTRKSGAEKDIATWGDLGLTGDWANKPISLYGRNSASGTYSYFKEHALAKGDFKDSVKEQAGSASVVQGVASDKYAIGYSGIGYRTADVRALPLAKDGKGKAIEPMIENAYTGEYPLARFLLVYFNQKPGTDLGPLHREFFRYVLSQSGQGDVVAEGYFPLTSKLLNKERAKLASDSR
jgi:phosphate transport system substrate-binding protein